MNKKETIEKIRKWIKDNALCQTTYSDICWDDGDIMFKRTDTEKKGDWSQKKWDEQISEFTEDYLSFKEFSDFLNKLEEDDNAS